MISLDSILSAMVVMATITLTVLVGIVWHWRRPTLTQRIRTRLKLIEAAPQPLEPSLKSAPVSDPSAIEMIADRWASRIRFWLRSAEITLEVKHFLALLAAYLLLCLIVVRTFLPPGLQIEILLLSPLIPLIVIQRRRHRRNARLSRQLPEAIDTMVRSLQAGKPLLQCWCDMGMTLGSPMCLICREIHLKLEYGGDLDQVLREAGSNVASDEVRFFLTSLSIQSKSGGNLVALLRDQADLLRERLALREKIRILSAESRLSAWIMGLMPFAVIGVMYYLSPQTVSLLWTTPGGRLMLQAGGALQLVGLIWIWKLVSVDG